MESQHYGDYGPRTAEDRARTLTEPGIGQRRLAESGARRRRLAKDSAILSSAGEYRHLGDHGVHHHELCCLHQRSGCAAGDCALAAHHAAPGAYLNTLVIIGSSFTLEIARRRIATFMEGLRDKDHSASPTRWLYVTLFLGLLFVAGQTLAWIQLRSQGFGLASNVSYSFFYVLTVAHALHVFGGLGGLVRVTRKLHNTALRRSTLDATARYWHFMGALWVYLLLLLWTKL